MRLTKVDQMIDKYYRCIKNTTLLKDCIIKMSTVLGNNHETSVIIHSGLFGVVEAGASSKFLAKNYLVYTIFDLVRQGCAY